MQPDGGLAPGGLILQQADAAVDPSVPHRRDGRLPGVGRQLELVAHRGAGREDRVRPSEQPLDRLAGHQRLVGEDPQRAVKVDLPRAEVRVEHLAGRG